MLLLQPRDGQIEHAASTTFGIIHYLHMKLDWAEKFGERQFIVQRVRGKEALWRKEEKLKKYPSIQLLVRRIRVVWWTSPESVVHKWPHAV